eukprot:TRINITY_DN30903_c0_g1_i2.p1 TRINITY_DN30903_c0_g1~~TRINITY_DN30903_c0_g1_i2.p1  ORF type:complete len:368 (-),score=35.30 TRINITY_DN30903_c0_g1_i2:233-1336(-)
MGGETNKFSQVINSNQKDQINSQSESHSNINEGEILEPQLGANLNDVIGNENSETYQIKNGSKTGTDRLNNNTNSTYQGNSNLKQKREQNSDASCTTPLGDIHTIDLERKYVHQVYDTIAPHFSSTRFAVWPRVRQFLGQVPQGGIVADVGCGNGKYFSVRDDIIVIGSDRSSALIETANRRINGKQGLGLEHNTRYGPLKSDAFVCDGYKVPMRTASSDAVLSIAVLHHVSGVDNRLKMLEELKRVVKVGGQVLVTVWAVEQENPQKTIAKWEKMEEGEEGDYLVPWHLPFHRVEAGRIIGQQQSESDEFGIGEVDQKKGAIVFKRYYHLYKEGELEGLVQKMNGVKVIDSFFDSSNWCVIFERVV